VAVEPRTGRLGAVGAASPACQPLADRVGHGDLAPWRWAARSGGRQRRAAAGCRPRRLWLRWRPGMSVPSATPPSAPLPATALAAVMTDLAPAGAAPLSRARSRAGRGAGPDRLLHHLQVRSAHLERAPAGAAADHPRTRDRRPHRRSRRGGHPRHGRPSAPRGRPHHLDHRQQLRPVLLLHGRPAREVPQPGQVRARRLRPPAPPARRLRRVLSDCPRNRHRAPPRRCARRGGGARQLRAGHGDGRLGGSRSPAAGERPRAGRRRAGLLCRGHRRPGRLPARHRQRSRPGPPDARAPFRSHRHAPRASRGSRAPGDRGPGA